MKAICYSYQAPSVVLPAVAMYDQHEREASIKDKRYTRSIARLDPPLYGFCRFVYFRGAFLNFWFCETPIRRTQPGHLKETALFALHEAKHDRVNDLATSGAYDLHLQANTNTFKLNAP